jgi:LmbE family N-acetylglucosaminyl deacetylase
MTPEENAQVRADDFTRIMTELGVRRHRVFVYGNDQNGRSLDFYPGHIDDYSAWMNLDDYGYIFLPHPLDNHPDHRYISVLLRNIAEKQQSKRNFRLAFYEVWSPLPDANVFAAIDAVVELKFRRLSQYRTVGGGYVTPIRGLNSYRALQGSIFQCAYAEAFTIAPAETLWRIPEQTPT